MKQVKIISGIYGHRPEGAKFVTPVSAGALAIISDDEAARLVSIGVAKYTDPKSAEVPLVTVATPLVDDEYDDRPDSDNGAEATETGADGDVSEGDEEDDEDETHAVPKYHVDMRVDQLRPLLESCGIAFKVGMTKGDMVLALDDYFTNTQDDGDTPPELGAEEPVL